MQLAPTETVHACAIGSYLTNEVFLYRVADATRTSAGEVLLLEDCYLLDVVRVPAEDLQRRRLRLVTPTG
jgi:hypothetical protein